MSKVASRKKSRSMHDDLLQRFRKTNAEGLPAFDNYDKPLEMGLWVLWMAKEKLNIRKLTANHIVDVIVGVMETSIPSRDITNAFNRAGATIHTSREAEETYYEIMKLGKDRLIEKAGEGSVKIYYFEPGRRYESKSVLATNILTGLKGELKIVDPYCDVRTLDVLSRAGVQRVKFLTRLQNVSPARQAQFQRELHDFESECGDRQFRDYSKSEVHDRYVISCDRLIILGHSLKDLGAKESFAIILDKKTTSDLFDALVETFNRRWKVASQL